MSREGLLEIKLGKDLNAEAMQMTMRRTFLKWEQQCEDLSIEDKLFYWRKNN